MALSEAAFTSIEISDINVEIIESESKSERSDPEWVLMKISKKFINLDFEAKVIFVLGGPKLSTDIAH